MPEYRNTKHPGIPTIYYVKTIGHRIRSVSCMHNNYYNSNVHAFCDNNIRYTHTIACLKFTITLITFCCADHRDIECRT